MKKNTYFFLHSEAADIPKLTWSVINRKYSENHQNILAVINLVQTLPASSAEVERGFSQLKILKSDIRSTLSEERLNDLLAVKLLSADIQNFDPMPAIELWNTSSVRTRRPLLMDRTSSRESSTAVVAVADTIVPSITVVAPSQEGTAEPTTAVATHSDSTPVAVATAATPQSNSEEFLPSVVLPPLEEDPEALDAEVIGCTAYDEEGDWTRRRRRGLR